MEASQLPGLLKGEDSSHLEFGGVLLSVLVWGVQGASQLPGCEGEGG